MKLGTEQSSRHALQNSHKGWKRNEGGKEKSVYPDVWTTSCDPGQAFSGPRFNLLCFKWEIDEDQISSNAGQIPFKNAFDLYKQENEVLRSVIMKGLLQTQLYTYSYLRLSEVGGGRGGERERNFATSILTFGCTPRKACSEMECGAAFPNLNTSQVTAANVWPPAFTLQRRSHRRTGFSPFSTVIERRFLIPCSAKKSVISKGEERGFPRAKHLSEGRGWGDSQMGWSKLKHSIFFYMNPKPLLCALSRNE